MYSSSSPSLSISTSSEDQAGGFYGKKNNKASKKKKTTKQIPYSEDKYRTTIDEPEFYPLPRSAKSDSHAHQTRKFQTEYMVPSPLDYDVANRLTKARAPGAVFVGTCGREGAVWPSHHYAKSEIRPKWSPHAVHSSPGPGYWLHTLCGRVDHDTSSAHRRAPWYSLGSRNRDVTEDRTPGPAYCPPEKVYRDGRDRGPAFSLASRRQDVTSY